MYSENLSVSTKNEEVSMFDKRTVIELNENQMTDVDGGSTPVCYGIIIGLCIAIKLM
jgi:hypothetical protein